MNNCIFCQIIKGESQVSAFYEDDVVLGLMTIDPVTIGHAMVIPKQHATYLKDMDEATGQHLFTITHRTAAAIRESGVKCEGVNLFLADGEAASQEVPHVHMHIFPRYKGDSFKLVADSSINPPREELDCTAQQIKAAYDKLWGSINGREMLA